MTGVGLEAGQRGPLEHARDDDLAHGHAVLLGGEVVKPDARELEHAVVEVVGQMIDGVHHAAQGVLLARHAEIALQGVCLLVVVAQTQRRHALQRHLGHADLDVLAAHVLDLRVEIVVVVQVGGALLGRAAHAARVGQGLARRGRIAGQRVLRYRGQRQPLESDGCSPHVAARVRQQKGRTRLTSFIVSAHGGPLGAARAVPVMGLVAARLRQRVPAL